MRRLLVLGLSSGLNFDDIPILDHGQDTCSRCGRARTTASMPADLEGSNFSDGATNSSAKEHGSPPFLRRPARPSERGQATTTGPRLRWRRPLAGTPEFVRRNCEDRRPSRRWRGARPRALGRPVGPDSSCAVRPARRPRGARRALERPRGPSGARGRHGDVRSIVIHGQLLLAYGLPTAPLAQGHNTSAVSVPGVLPGS